MANKKIDFAHVHRHFNASVSAFDCGRFCAPMNGGEPVCCSTDHAVPVMEKAEFASLRSRSDLWRRFTPADRHDRKIVAELPKDCMAAACKGARFCERDNRSIACRAFPFYPYLNNKNEVLGLACYWIFEDRCWVISNMAVVEREFVKEFISTFEYIMARDESELESFRWQSAQHRRVFSRWRRPIYLIGREGGFLKILPKGAGIKKANASELPRYHAYKSEKAYRRAIAKVNGDLPGSDILAQIIA